MNSVVKELLKGNSGDYIFPFFWQHGEDETTLRKMMDAIDKANCKSVCIESRPHPDFCGEKWWRDLDIILDEARKRNMKVWILDDSHFPTGFANGAIKNAPLDLHRQSIATSCKRFTGKEKDIVLNLTKVFPPKNDIKNFMATTITKIMSKGAPHFNDDKILSITAIGEDKELIDIPFTNTGIVTWHKPNGTYDIYVTGLSRNMGIHREYINMMSKESCRVLIDTVYEKHYEHYKDDFGKTILGFFSDEPELGNGLYMTGANRLGTDIDQPYSDEVEVKLKELLGENWKNKIVYLWDNSNPEEAAKVRYAYMDTITKLVRKDFSEQIGTWCKEHGVKYIGHIIEDNNSHSRTGMSLGHYFRGLNGQHMSGIDDIGGQVLPQGEDKEIKSFFGNRDGEFYHFALGNLGASAAAIEPQKNGDAMCEIFGNYGWSEGLRLEKYLADHFMVRGINHFVPHAFTGKEFPDPDCPPHFYAHGHNPEYRHFGRLVEYMNRVCSLISNGHRESKVAVLYNAELEWMGESMLIQKPLRKLYENQILADTIPLDVFFETERYNTSFNNKLKVNNQEYELLIVPYTQFINKDIKDALERINIPIIFIDNLPIIIDSDETLNYQTVSLDNLVKEVKKYVKPVVDIVPNSKDIRVLEYTNENKIIYIFNEASKTYHGTLDIDYQNYYEYDAWNNKIYKLDCNDIVIEPNKSIILIEDTINNELLSERIKATGEKRQLNNFKRSIVKSIAYPNFINETEVLLGDDYSKVDKYFSGIIRYEKEIEIYNKKKVVLEITDAYEGVEVFVNDKSLGIQIVPTFLYDLSDYLIDGKNKLVIEVATTLEREMSRDKSSLIRDLAVGTKSKTMSPTGITGEVYLYIQD